MENEIISDDVPLLYKRYVDDCIMSMPYDKLENTFRKFNSFHPKHLNVSRGRYRNINSSYKPNKSIIFEAETQNITR